MSSLSKVLGSRDLLWQMIGADLRGRYAGSVLGLFWNVIHPLILISIYILVFSRLIGARLGSDLGDAYAFGIYLCAALLPWNAFAEVLSRSTSIYAEHGNLVRKIAFPKILLHLYVLGTAAVHAGLITVIFLCFLIAVGHLPPPLALGMWLGIFLLQLALAAGLGLVTSIVNVYFRDMTPLVGVGLQLGFWLTPIVYVADVLPPAARGLLAWNPLSHFSRVQQDLILRGALPGPAALALLVALAAVPLLIGIAFFARARHRIADEL
jgi:lipopolysaccharide transport system permease protein